MEINRFEFSVKLINKLDKLDKIDPGLALRVGWVIRRLPEFCAKDRSDEALAEYLLRMLNLKKIEPLDFGSPAFERLLAVKEVFDEALLSGSFSPSSSVTATPEPLSSRPETPEPPSIDTWAENLIGPLDLTREHAFTKGLVDWIRGSRASLVPQEGGVLRLGKMCTATGTIMKVSITLQVENLTITREGDTLHLDGLSLNGYKGRISLRCERQGEKVQFVVVNPKLPWGFGWLGTVSLNGLLEKLNALKWDS